MVSRFIWTLSALPIMSFNKRTNMGNEGPGGSQGFLLTLTRFPDTKLTFLEPVLTGPAIPFLRDTKPY